MAITKTNFINYTRCPKYVNLENVRKDKLKSNLSLEDYKKEEENEKYNEILNEMFNSNDGIDIDLTKKTDEQLEAMMDYYKKVELLAGREVNKLFGGKSIFSEETYNQESFDFTKNGLRYLCYVDIFNETDDEINIIEVKATTSNKLLKLIYGKKNTAKKTYPKYGLFSEKNGIYYLNECEDLEAQSSYNTNINKLKNRYSDEGKYIYDLSVQRYIIENDLKQNKINKKINYYLCVLNHKYIYDGKSDYETDINGNSIITLFNLNNLTKQMMDVIDKDRILLEHYFLDKEQLNKPCFCKGCELKKRTQCIYKDICYKEIPNTNACYNYVDFRSFKDGKDKYNKYDLLNLGYKKLSDIPYSWIISKNHRIQRDSYDKNEEYINKEKIKTGLSSLKYPIYHLDFETFPCPLPRFKGESPYIQSPFEFSLHIEHSPGECDKDKDNYVFLAKTEDDEREELIKQLIQRIDTKKGCMLAQNVGFEKSRIKELANMFPKYHDELMKIYDMGFDLLWLVRANKELYTSLGYTESEATELNYYHPNLSGSYSIKKTLPVFSDLSYKDLDIGNGTEALVEYSKYHLKTPEELEKTRNDLIVYCKQDTWAMVEILKGLREKVK